MDIPVNALSIRGVYWRKMFQNIPNIHILWAFMWLNELRLKANGMHHLLHNIFSYINRYALCRRLHCTVAYFYVFDWIIKSRAVRKPLPSHQECCLAPRNRYAASLRPETVTILQRDILLERVNSWCVILIHHVFYIRHGNKQQL